MYKQLLLLNLVLFLMFSFNLIKKVEYPKLVDDFTIIGSPNNNFLDSLGFEQTDYSNYISINTVNLMSETAMIGDIIVDTEAIYYALFKSNHNDLLQRMEYYSSIAAQEGDEQSYKKLHDFEIFLQNNSMNNKEKILDYLNFTNQYEFNPGFFRELLLIDNETIEFNMDYKNEIYKTKTVYYYEDFDLDNTLSSVYKESEVINVDLYYLRNDVCDDFNFIKKIDANELLEFTENLLPNQMMKTQDCYVQLFTNTGEIKKIDVYDEELYPHKNIFVFEYQSHTTRPYIRSTVVFDFWNQEKMLITSEYSSFKITKEAHYRRNDYNCEQVYYDSELMCYSVAELYPTKYYIENHSQWLYLNKNYFHQLGSSNKENVKYLKVVDYYDDYKNLILKGNLELVYDEFGDIVTDDEIIFTYNFGTTEIDHYVKDIFPYLVWGNTEVDRITSTAYARFIWDKDRFTSNKRGQSLNGTKLINYFENNRFIQYIGTKIPQLIIDNEIDAYYFAMKEND